MSTRAVFKTPLPAVLSVAWFAFIAVFLYDFRSAAAAAIVALYDDASRWQHISADAIQALEAFTPAAVLPRLEAVFAR